MVACSYIDPVENTSRDYEEGGTTNISVECQAEAQPQQWHFRVVDTNDSTKYLYDESGSVSIEGEMLSVLVYNSDAENIEMEEDKEINTTIAKAKRTDAIRLNNGKPVALMPDKLFSEYMELETSEISKSIVLSPESRIKTYPLRLEMTAKGANVTGCKTALIDGMAESINLNTLTLSESDVALAVPLWLDDTLETDSNPTATALGRITTFGRATESTSCTLFVTIQLENGTEITVSIDMTDDMGEETEGNEIVKRVTIDSTDNGGNTFPVTIDERETENTHVNL